VIRFRPNQVSYFRRAGVMRFYHFIWKCTCDGRWWGLLASIIQLQFDWRELSFFEVQLSSPYFSQPTNFSVRDTWPRASSDDDIRVPDVFMTNSRVLGTTDERRSFHSLRELAYKLRNVGLMKGTNAVVGTLCRYQHESIGGFTRKGEHTGANTCEPTIGFPLSSASFWPSSNNSCLASAMF
jgi:hypothetical protein